MRLMTLQGLFLSATCGFLLAAAGAGCGGDDGGGDNMMMAAPKCTADKVTGTSSQYATNDLRLPQSSGSKTFAYDFNKDGKQENQLKTLIQAVSVAGLNLQDSVTKAVADGEAVILGEVKAPDLMKSDCASVTLSLAKGPEMGDKPPVFDGNDMFKVGTVMGVKLFGKIEGGVLTTTASADQTAEDEQRIEIQLPLSMGTVLPLALRGVHIQGTVTMDKGVAAIKDGQLHGVISQRDIDGKIVPLVAQLVTKMINDKPDDSTTKTIINLFENQMNDVSKNKCMNTPAKCCKTNPMTCEILDAEIKLSPVGGVLASDIEAFDGQDRWAPSKENKNKNGMSVGLGFSMIKAKF